MGVAGHPGILTVGVAVCLLPCASHTEAGGSVGTAPVKWKQNICHHDDEKRSIYVYTSLGFRLI